MKTESSATLFSSLLESCVRFPFYAEVIKTPLSRTFAYLTLLAGICAASMTLYIHTIILPRVTEAADTLPALSLRNGKIALASEDAPAEPRTIYADPQRILRIDLDLESKGGLESTRDRYNYLVVISKYHITLRRLGGEIHQFSAPYGFDLKVSVHTLHSVIESWLWLILLLTFAGSFLIYFAITFVLALALTVPGLVFWSLLRRDLTYGRLLTLCLYALTAPTWFSILLWWMNTRFELPRILFDFFWVFYMLIALEYLVGGIAAMPPGEKQRDETARLQEGVYGS